MDAEKNGVPASEPAEVGTIRSPSWSSEKGEEAPPTYSRGFFRDFIDGFKRADLSGIDTTGMSEVEIQNYLSSKAPLKRSLKGWQIQMIAIGGSIGSGLFIGSGSSFSSGGPAGVLIGFGAMGVMIFFTMQAAGELAVRFPQNGSFLAYITRFIDPSWSLAMCWNYLLQWLCTFPLEIISTAITLSYWNSDNNGATNVNKAAWAALFYAVCVFINLFGAKGFGYGESILSIIKVVTIVGFCIFGICVTAGGRPHQYFGPYEGYGPDSQYIGAYFYNHRLGGKSGSGAFADGAKGVFSVLVNAAFSFSGTELSALAAAETANPTKALPRACKTIALRIMLFYIVSLCIAGFLVPYDDPRLGAAKDGSASPFVIAVTNSHVRALPSIINTVICLAVLSVGNSCVYAASRTTASMGAQGFLPRFFAYIDREGRPLIGLILVSLFGLLCFLAATPKYGEVFDWLLALSGLSSVFTWGSICLAHIRFRMGMHRQGRSLEELQFKACLGPWGSIIGLGLNLAVIGLQFWTAAWPQGYGTLSPREQVKGFFEGYLSVPIVLAFYIVAKFAYYRDFRTLFVRAKDMDLDSGAREFDWEELKQRNLEEQERLRSKPWWYRAANALC